MYPASVIAYEFVKKAIAEGMPVTQMKLQKMVFFAHGYHLAKFAEPLVKEHFQAWKFGPVVPGIYHDYKLYGSDPIVDTKYVQPNLHHVSKSDSKALDAIHYTWEATKDVPTIALSNWTHQANSPWSKAYKPGEKDIPIDNSAIKEYFDQFLANPA